MKWFILEPAYFRNTRDKIYYWVAFALLGLLFSLIAWALYLYTFNGEVNDYLGIGLVGLIFVVLIIVMTYDYFRSPEFSIVKVLKEFADTFFNSLPTS